jgi:hypothetical protein
MVNTGVMQHIALRNIAVRGADPHLAQALINHRIKIHDQDFPKQIGLFPLNLGQQGTGGP